MIARADAALYQAKRRGRNRVATEQDFSKSIFIASAEIEAALQEERLIPAYQPIVELASGRAVADEALARIRGRDGGLLPAGLFIEAASELQIAHRIDQAIVTQATQRCARQVIAAPDAPRSTTSSISPPICCATPGASRPSWPRRASSPSSAACCARSPSPW
ncbi:MAG: EAL domain-containing protein [Halothiobacillaceae bacterium]